jgi:hypothetical protein
LHANDYDYDYDYEKKKTFQFLNEVIPFLTPLGLNEQKSEKPNYTTRDEKDGR